MKKIWIAPKLIEVEYDHGDILIEGKLGTISFELDSRLGIS